MVPKIKDKNREAIGMDTRIRIKIELLKKGIEAKEIAQKLGVSRSLVYKVIAGRRKNPKVRQALAEVVGIPVEELWPDQKKAA